MLGYQVRLDSLPHKLVESIQTDAGAEELKPHTLIEIRNCSAAFNGIKSGRFQAELGNFLKFDIAARCIGKGYRLSREYSLAFE